MDGLRKLLMAQQQVADIKAFYAHVVAYVLVMSFLVAVNFVDGPELWVHWPALAWGLGVLVHAAAVYNLGGWLGPHWENRQLHKVLAREAAARREASRRMPVEAASTPRSEAVPERKPDPGNLVHFPRPGSR